MTSLRRWSGTWSSKGPSVTGRPNNRYMPAVLALDDFTFYVHSISAMIAKRIVDYRRTVPSSCY